MGFANILKDVAVASAKVGAKGAVSAGATLGMTAYEGLNTLSKIPWQISVPVAALAGVALESTNQRPQVQISRSPSPISTNNPSYVQGGYNSTANLKDMGATGDLVLSLNQLSH